jgi:hypothetical protein
LTELACRLRINPGDVNSIPQCLAARFHLSNRLAHALDGLRFLGGILKPAVMFGERLSRQADVFGRVHHSQTLFRGTDHLRSVLQLGPVSPLMAQLL